MFLALVRTLAEFHRLEYTLGAALTLAQVAPYITGALMAALGAWAGVVAYYFGFYRLVSAIVAVAIALMLTYKLVTIGGWP
ncbi:MAG: hypothetical protein ACREJT_07445 [Myxococcota bacterium]